VLTCQSNGEGRLQLIHGYDGSFGNAVLLEGRTINLITQGIYLLGGSTIRYYFFVHPAGRIITGMIPEQNSDITVWSGS
jgi:hypothetical protein